MRPILQAFERQQRVEAARALVGAVDQLCANRAQAGLLTLSRLPLGCGRRFGALTEKKGGALALRASTSVILRT
jgi:hypothetical protein